MQKLKDPPVWKEDELEKQRLVAIKLFREERMAEPLEKYLEAFEEVQGNVENLLETLVDMTDLDDVDEDTITSAVGDDKLLHVLRYLPGPPISSDDLKVICDVKTMNPSKLKKNAAASRVIFETVLQGLDRRRFPWVSEQREPTDEEKHAAIIATTAMMATKRAETARRHEGKDAQEHAVHKALKDIQFKRVDAKKIRTFDDAPKPGEFCGECELGSRKADVVVRLHDKRILAVECKVSNSSTNSIKRLNNDAAVKATVWTGEFGGLHVVPSAMLSGVYNLKNLQTAQEKGLTLWWAHDLKAFQKWVEAAQP